MAFATIPATQRTDCGNHNQSTASLTGLDMGVEAKGFSAAQNKAAVQGVSGVSGVLGSLRDKKKKRVVRYLQDRRSLSGVALDCQDDQLHALRHVVTQVMRTAQHEHRRP